MSLIVTIMINDRVIANYAATRVTNVDHNPRMDEISDYEITDIPNERVVGMISHRQGDGAHSLAARVLDTADYLHQQRKARS
jgi:hypothetical protein